MSDRELTYRNFGVALLLLHTVIGFFWDVLVGA